MFKRQSLTFNFKSYLKRQEKTTSKKESAHNAIELLQVDLTRIPEENILASKEWFFGCEDISSGATKSITMVFNMGGMGNFCQHRIVFSPFTN